MNSRHSNKETNLIPPPFEWCSIPAGEVTLIENYDDKSYFGRKGEKKTFPVPAFAIAKYPVTNAQFASFIGAKGYEQKQWWTKVGWQAKQKQKWTQPRYWQDKKWNQPDHPVVGVSWYEAVAFCAWLTERLNDSPHPDADAEGLGVRVALPTEHQWQRAAQGDDNRAYPWGNDWDCQRCNNSVKPCESESTTPVSQYEGRDKGDSPFGVVDMAGNVWEWCLTKYDTGGTELDGTDVRLLRGGSWVVRVAGYLTAVYRHGFYPGLRNSYGGFRPARS